jgi:hypothetical protein
MPATAETRRTSRRARATWKSRAVVRTIEAGSDAYCEHCGERVKFQAKHKHQQVICNVYVKGTWDRVEHYHAACYDLAGQPYGAAAA